MRAPFPQGSTAFMAPTFTESTRLICPAPTLTAWPARAYTMAFDFTCLHTFHANSSARHSSSVGGALGLHLHSRRVQAMRVRRLRQVSAADRFHYRLIGRRGVTFSSRRFFLAQQSRAPGV